MGELIYGSSFAANRRSPGATRRSQVLAKELVARERYVVFSQATPGTTALQATPDGLGRSNDETQNAGKPLHFFVRSLRSWRTLGPASWQVPVRRAEGGGSGRSLTAATEHTMAFKWTKASRAKLSRSQTAAASEAP